MTRAAFLIAFLIAVPAWADRYVDDTGCTDASNSCTNPANPCCTIQAAVTLAACGETVIVGPGVYTTFSVTNKVCTESSQLNIRPSIYPTRSTASTGARISYSSGYGYRNEESNWITFEGFYIDQQAGANFAFYMNGDRAEGHGQHNTIKNVEVKSQIRSSIQPCAPGCGQLGYSTSPPLRAYYQDDLIVNGLIAGRDAAGTCNMCDETTCFSVDNSRRTLMQNSTCYGYRSVGNFSNSQDITYQDNRNRDNHNHGVGFVDCDRALIQRNIWDYTNTDKGIEDIVWIVCSWDINARNNAVIGNTVMSPVQGFQTHNNCGNDANGNLPVTAENPNHTYSTDLTFSNNIFTKLWGTTSTHGLPVAFPADGLTVAPLVVDYNLYYDNRHIADANGTLYSTLAAWRARAYLCPGGTPCQDLNSIETAPTFVDPTNATWSLRDYRPLNGSSPQVDAGDDSNCAHAIVGSHCDIGPYEFAGGGADTAAPSGVSNVAPANAATGVSLTPTLTAATASDATTPIQYEFQLFQAANCNGSTGQTRAYSTATTWQPSTLAASTQYAWRNRARDAVSPTPNVSSYSTCTTFTTAAATTDIACNETAFEAAIAEINAGTRTRITFACSDQVIALNPSRFANRVLNANRPGVEIDGENKNLTFDSTPPWWDAITTLCGGGNCDPGNTGTPTLCPDTADGTTNMWFVRLLGQNDKVKNLTFRYFMEGIRMEASGVEVEGVAGVLPGDEDVSNPPTGGIAPNVIIRNCTFSAACDKNIQAYGNEAPGSASWDMQIFNTVVTNSRSGLRVSLNGGPGRFRIEDSLFIEEAPGSSLFNSDGPYIGDPGSGDDLVLYMKNTEILGTRRGLRLTGDSQFISGGGNLFSGNLRRGLQCEGTARCFVQGDTFTNNGGSTTSGDSLSGYGGIALGGLCVGGANANVQCTSGAGCSSGVCSVPILDAGGGPPTLFDGTLMSSTGGNTFSGNLSATDPTLDIHNLTAVTVPAENNCWGTTDLGVIATRVTGSVDYDPVGLCGASIVTTMRGGISRGGTSN